MVFDKILLWTMLVFFVISLFPMIYKYIIKPFVEFFRWRNERERLHAMRTKISTYPQGGD